MSLETALGAAALRDDAGLCLAPRSERELVEGLLVLKEQGARLGREVRLARHRLSRLLPIDERALTVEAEAGVPVRELEQRANAVGLSLGVLSPGAWALDVGGLLEHPAYAYRPAVCGRLEPLAARVTGVLANGQLVTSMPGPRHAAGPDLAALVLGGAGRLGLVTSAALRLAPSPARELRRLFSFQTSALAVEALREALSAGVTLTRVVLRGRGGRVVVECELRGLADQVEREVALLGRLLERSGRFEGQGREAEVDGAEREIEWEAVVSSVASGASLELFRLALSAVVARGAPAGARVAASPLVARLQAAVDPSCVLGGEP